MTVSCLGAIIPIIFFKEDVVCPYMCMCVCVCGIRELLPKNMSCCCTRVYVKRLQKYYASHQEAFFSFLHKLTYRHFKIYTFYTVIYFARKINGVLSIMGLKWSIKTACDSHRDAIVPRALLTVARDSLRTWSGLLWKLYNAAQDRYALYVVITDFSSPSRDGQKTSANQESLDRRVP